jgi:HSP20 family protein
MTHIKYTSSPWTTEYTSTFDILFKDFFNANSTFVSPINQKIGHPVDIYENKKGLFFEIAATGLSKQDIKISIEGDVLRIIHDKVEESLDKNEVRYYNKGISRRSFNLGYKIARRFDLTAVDAQMKDGLLTIHLPHTEENKPQEVNIK